MIKSFDKSVEKNRVIFESKEYQYIKPAHDLKKTVSYYNVSFPSKQEYAQNYQIMPSLTSVIAVAISGNDVFCEVWGASSQTKKLEPIAFQHDFLLLIEFKHAGLFSLLPIQQSEILNKRLKLEDINKVFHESIKELVFSSESIKELVIEIDKLLINHTKVTDGYLLIIDLLDYILKLETVPSLADIISFSPFSHRHTNRLFQKYIGVSIKEFLRIVRLNRTILSIKDTSYNLTYIAYMFGYCDQPHLINEFKKLTDVTLSEFKKEKSNFYNDFVKYDVTMK